MSIKEIANKINQIDHLEVLIRFRPGFNKFFAAFTHNVSLKYGTEVEDFLFHKWVEDDVETLYEHILESFINADMIIIDNDKGMKKEYKYDKETEMFLLVSDEELENLFLQQKQKLTELDKIIHETNQRFETSLQNENDLIQFLNEKMKTSEYHSRNNLLKNTIMKYTQLIKKS